MVVSDYAPWPVMPMQRSRKLFHGYHTIRTLHAVNLRFMHIHELLF